ncbi:EAL domain-containing protein [Rhizobacter sp. AJA081-3]|uniref:putative bifunctional diguanylate cyclase/phosphodiesterase n=1 Tax=Rhizobacter sp. AJA081-3 TaxID=2753607 RepID=UPI001AE08BB1|nr:EAL domain-containing protein [Rhizobacter sp. AJA081-3]QTN24743.1 EAL domain-containing protein [Rhizobacter sp. AJA081-3]
MSSHRPRPFRLTRYFSLASLAGILLVTASLFWTFRALTERHLLDQQSRSNAELTRAFANSVWGRYRVFVATSTGRSRDDLLADAALAGLRADVLTKMHGLSIAKVKIYNLAGTTVFSTDASQIGEDKSGNQGFNDARAGGVASQITYRERFDAFEGVINNRNLIASYVPIRISADSPVEGVFEVYADVTELIDKQHRAQWQVAAIVLMLLGTLYGFLLIVVRKADGIIAAQEAERAAKEEQVRHQAYHDALTGLPNRAYFSERLSEAVSLAARHGHNCGLMFIDLDRFKIVNDSLGHPAGDALLRAVSERIHQCLRGSDLLFRMGGDEFTVILPQVGLPEDAAYVARRITAAVAQPVTVQGHELTVGATIGIAVFPADGQSAEALVKNADAAMYAAKEGGRGTHAFYSADMNQRSLQRLDLECALKKGFRDGEFELHYQPRIDAATRRVVALEALLRWASPTRGLVLPGMFIGTLEDTGMMPIVGEWVLRTACAQTRAWHEAGMAPLRVSVNVSTSQFQSDTFVPMVRRVLAESGAVPAQLELELTESLLIAHADRARTTIAELKAMGLRISIDDFGTGYSSLNYLRHLDVDFLKIDRSFVTDIASNPRDRAVASAIIELAGALDIAVVAEGVETQAQAAFFSSTPCAELQGFLFCRPLPAQRVMGFVAEEQQSLSSVRAQPGDATGLPA